MIIDFFVEFMKKLVIKLYLNLSYVKSSFQKFMAFL